MTGISVGVTGAAGFIGSHLVDRLMREDGFGVIPLAKHHFEDRKGLMDFVSGVDVLVHLAAVNRGEEKVIHETNVGLIRRLVSCMEEAGAAPHLIFSSSSQVAKDNAYGRSKREGAEILKNWALKNRAPLTVLLIPNVFGDRCRPFYNSVVATFCYQLTHGQEPEIMEDREVDLLYINELTENILRVISNTPHGVEEMDISGTATITVSELLSILENFRDCYFLKKVVPALESAFLVNLYNVFLSYLDYNDLFHAPVVHDDPRGELYEVIKLSGGGQVFFSTTRPGMVRGNHYHTRKIERFCVLKGRAVIRLRRIGTAEVVEFRMEDSPAFVDIPVFHTHNIENVGNDDLHTLFWSNEVFDHEDTDTFFEEV